MLPNNNGTGRKARFLFTRTEPVQLALTLADGCTRVFEQAFPVPENSEEEEAVRVLFCERVGNLLACLGGRKLGICAGEKLKGLLSEADGIIRSEKGCARAVRVADRVNAALSLPPFTVEVTDTPFKEEAKSEEVGASPLTVSLRAKAETCTKGIRLGIDVGGTDIKAVAFKDGRLAAVKEYDWAPAEYGTPEEITGPIIRIARLLILAAALYPAIPEAVKTALSKEASCEAMERAVSLFEGKTPGAVCASIGLSYPDVIIRDRIAGGETPKTKGLQEHDPAHYEETLVRLGQLKDGLAALLMPGGTLHLANDGNIAAYTAAAELSFSENASSVDRGVFAHSLGTDLGTGLLLGDGSIPEAPLELYTFRTGTEEKEALVFPPEDVRSARTVHSGLRGAERRVGQAAAFRYAYSLAPRLLEGFTEERNGLVRVITAPEDKRKALLEHLMVCADAGDPQAGEVFIRIGRALGEITLEAEALLRTGMRERYVFGRFVKRARVFSLIEKGFRELCTGYSLIAADSALAKSPLMKALAADPSVTVAQFGQAVGAVYYGA